LFITGKSPLCIDHDAGWVTIRQGKKKKGGEEGGKRGRYRYFLVRVIGQKKRVSGVRTSVITTRSTAKGKTKGKKRGSNKGGSFTAFEA